ncbi:MAG TPA: hypothetical protein VGD26_07780 [Chitinophagaceae bacterium]
MDLYQDLEIYWAGLLSPFQPSKEVSDQLFSQLVKTYNEEGRHYHTIDHIEKLVHLADHYSDIIQKKTIVGFSILYHDIVYRPGMGDNEELSAERAEVSLNKLNVPPATIEEVKEFIITTKFHHSGEVTDPDLKYFLDFDLSILAAPREEYMQYVKNVRKEFAHLSDAHFAWGRRSFLQSILAKPFIYFTSEFRRLESDARENMNWEISEVSVKMNRANFTS